MDMFVFLYYLSYVVVLIPSAFGVFCGYKYRSRTIPSCKLIAVLCAVSAGSLWILFAVPAVSMVHSGFLLAGSVVTGSVGLAFWVHQFCRVCISSVVVGIGLAQLVIWVWVDHRFRVVAQYPDGSPVDIREESVSLHRPNWNYFQSYVEYPGTKLKNGTIYFGLIKWLQYKDDWVFSGTFTDQDGRCMGDLGWDRAKWSEWPKHVTVECR